MVWKKVPFSHENDEFDRVATDLTRGRPDEVWEANFAMLQAVYKTSQVVILSDAVWKKLKNTDSWQTTDEKKIKSAIRKNSASSGSRDIAKVIKEISGSSPRAPIVFEEKGSYTLVAGNTRLMACRVLKIQPSVVMMKIKPI